LGAVKCFKFYLKVKKWDIWNTSYSVADRCDSIWYLIVTKHNSEVIYQIDQSYKIERKLMKENVIHAMNFLDYLQVRKFKSKIISRISIAILD